MKHGIIKLVSPMDEVVKTRQYWGKEERRSIIEMWRRQYGGRFKYCYIHLLPEINIIAVRKDGTNMRYKKDTSVAKNGVATKNLGKNHPEHKVDHRETTDPYNKRWFAKSRLTLK